MDGADRPPRPCPSTLGRAARPRTAGVAMSTESATEGYDTETASDGPRRQRVLRGDRMATPRKALRLGDELLRPGRDRLAPDHPLVRAHPDLFAPAWAGDSETR